MRSEVFDNFIKIATEKGFVSTSEAEHTEKNTKNPRWDSLDISAIEALYGVKPDAPKDMDYENNIAEVAHPNSVVISPSYDKLNGLVENINERQNILLHILYKEPEVGSHTQKKYPLNPSLIYPNTLGNVAKRAYQNLILSLVRVGNDMDNKEKDDLRVLADTCLSQLHLQGFKKQAIIPWLIGASLILAVTYMQQHLDDTDQGLKQNYNKLQSELQDFANASTSLGFGHEYDMSLKSQISQLQSLLNEFWSAYSAAMPVLLELEKPRNAQDLAQQAMAPQTKNLEQAYEVLRDEAAKLYPYLNKFQQNFSNPDFKAEHTADKGTFTSLLDKVPFLHGGKSSLIADDFDDVINAIGPFKASVKRLLDVLSQAAQHKDAIQEDVDSNIAKTKSELGQDPFQNPAPSKQESKSVKDIDDEASGLDQAFQNLKNLIPGMGD